MNKHYTEFVAWMDQYLQSLGWEGSRDGQWYKYPGKNPLANPAKALVSMHDDYLTLIIPGNLEPNLDNPTPKMFKKDLRDMVISVMGVRGGSYKERVNQFKQNHPNMEWWRS